MLTDAANCRVARKDMRSSGAADTLYVSALLHNVYICVKPAPTDLKNNSQPV